MFPAQYLIDVKKVKYPIVKTAIGRTKFIQVSNDPKAALIWWDGFISTDEYINLLEEGKYEELVEKYLVEYYDPLYMHSVDKYKYNEVINFDDVDSAVEEVIKFHQSAMEGAIKC